MTTLSLKKIAFVTQSYKDDYNECNLLCDSIDRFAPLEIMHFIFVNDEDYDLFKPLQSDRRVIYKKSIILPKYLLRFPFPILGHHYHVSLFTIPVREWIIQQICKLGVFEVIGSSYDAVFNIDSETVLMRPLDLYKWINDKGEYLLFRDLKRDEPSKQDYYKSAKKLLNISNEEIKSIEKWNYMNTPVCFERSNLESLLNKIGSIAKLGDWKLVLCNTYRFSEYYMYGIYSDYFLKCKNHFLTNIHYFPQLEMPTNHSKEFFLKAIDSLMCDENTMGLWLQKANRKSNSNNYIDFEVIRQIITEYWENNKNIK